MSEIKFSANQKAEMITKVKLYFSEELGIDIGGFDAEFLIDFFSKEMAGYFYNQGLFDAQQLVSERLEHLSDAIYELERPIEI